MEANDRSELLTVHMLPELRHTGGYTNDARKALVDAWLDQQSDSFILGLSGLHSRKFSHVLDLIELIHDFFFRATSP